MRRQRRSARGRLRLNYYRRADGSDRRAARERDLRTVIAKLERMGFSVASAVVVSLALTMSFAWFLASPGQVHACKCAVPGTPAEELEKFSAVFAGSVVSIRHSYDLNAASYTPDDRTTVGFEVSTVWKGTVHEDVSITTPPTGGSCGFTFAEGGRVRRLCRRQRPMATTATPLAYAVERRSSDKHRLTSMSSARAVLPRPGAGGPAPEQPQDSGVGAAWIIIPIVVVTGLVVGGTMVYRTMRRR